MKNKLSFMFIFTLLLDSKCWKVRRKSTHLEYILHNDGWRYFTNCGGCINLHREFGNGGRLILPWEWIILGPLGYINTLKVKKTLKH